MATKSRRATETKVRRWRPTVVAFVDIHPYRVVSGIKDARVGLQKPLFGSSRVPVKRLVAGRQLVNVFSLSHLEPPLSLR